MLIIYICLAVLWCNLAIHDLEGTRFLPKKSVDVLKKLYGRWVSNAIKKKSLKNYLIII
jgi:hypothetical protein